MTALAVPCSPISILRVEGTLRTPLDFELRHKLDALIRRGDRLVLLNLSGLVYLAGRVRHLLELAGLLPVLVAAR